MFFYLCLFENSASVIHLGCFSVFVHLELKRNSFIRCRGTIPVQDHNSQVLHSFLSQKAQRIYLFRHSILKRFRYWRAPAWSTLHVISEIPFPVMMIKQFEIYPICFWFFEERIKNRVEHRLRDQYWGPILPSAAPASVSNMMIWWYDPLGSFVYFEQAALENF